MTTQVEAILGATPEPAMVELVFDRSEGNAFFVEELVRTVRDGAAEYDLPPSLRDVLLPGRATVRSRPAGGIGASSSAAMAYRALTAAEELRREDEPAVAAWQEALNAWEAATDVWPFDLHAVPAGRGSV